MTKVYFIWLGIGITGEEKTLREVGIKNAVKIMVVGSTLTDVLTVTAPAKGEIKEEKAQAAATKEPLCKQTVRNF